MDYKSPGTQVQHGALVVRVGMLHTARGVRMTLYNTFPPVSIPTRVVDRRR